MSERDLIWKQYDERMATAPTEPEAGLERFNPMRFKREMTVFRIGHLASRIVELGDKLELPTGSILHLLDDVEHPNDHLDTPRVDENFFIQHESFRKYIYHVKDFDLQDGPILIEDKYIYRISGLPRNLMAFRSQYGSKFRYCNSIAELPAKKEALIIVNHNPLFRVRFYGRLQYFRKIQMILASVLNTAHRLTPLDKQQFIMLPWGTEVYDKQMFLRSRTVLNMTTVKRPESWHYILMMHLVNFMWDKATTSMFKQLPAEDLNQINLILQCGNKYVFYNLADLLAINVKNIAYYRFINQLNMLSILGRVPEDADPATTQKIQEHFQQLTASEDTDVEVTEDLVKSIFTTKDSKDNGVAVADTTTADVKEGDTPVPQAGSDVTEQDRTAAARQDREDEVVINRAAVDIPIIQPFKTIARIVTDVPRPSQSTTTVTKSATPTNNKGTKAALTKTEQVAAAKTTNSAQPMRSATSDATVRYMREQQTQANTFIEQQAMLSVRQKERCRILSQKYKDLELHGRRMADILTEDNDIGLDHKPLDPKVLGIEAPDPAALTANPKAYDESYLAKTFDKHFVGAINSFQRNGVFLTGIKEKKVVSELNNYTDYSLQYEDVNGKKSTIKLRIPTITREGKIVIDGIPKVLRKQRVTLPIVKTSDTTISLSSNYNKTQVIRNVTKAHNFFSYIDGLVNSKKSNAVVVYGNCVIRDLPLAYEYTQLADKYKSIEFKADDRWSLWFDYNTRVTHFADSEEKLAKLEAQYGTYFGSNSKDWLFIDEQNTVRAVRITGGEDVDFPYNSITEICKLSLKEGEKYDKELTEWISIKILDKMLPVIFLLAYRYGLRATLDYMGIKYAVTERRTKTIVGSNEENVEVIPGTETFSADTRTRNQRSGHLLFLLHFIHEHQLSADLKQALVRDWNKTTCEYTDRSVLFHIDYTDKVAAETVYDFLRQVTESFNSHFDGQYRIRSVDTTDTGITVYTDPLPIAAESFGVNSDAVAGVTEDEFFGTDWIKIAGQEALEDTTASTPTTTKYVPQPGDIGIKFTDRVLWINRYPLAQSLVVSGLAAFDTSSYDLADFESKDIYYQILSDQGLSINYLKGIDSFFDLFIDNMTYSVLESMHEPTNVRDLLLRCGVLLSTMDHRQASSRANHRIRGYEQINAVIYNEMTRQFAAYQSRRGAGNTFSVNPDAIYLRIVTNSSLVPSECPNPIQDLKEQAAMTYAGSGGRTSESFVVEHRKFSQDDIGVIAEATVYNGKVGINAQLAFNAGITNTEGTLAAPDELTAGNTLSATACLFPFAMHDDKLFVRL